MFFGQLKESSGVRLNYLLNYLPNLITNETQHILHKVTTKEGDKPNFKRYRNDKEFSVNSSNGKYKYIYTFNSKGEPNYQYSDNIGDNNINMDKVVMTFGGGIASYKIQFIPKEQQIGSYDKTMYSEVKTHSEGKHLEQFFNSDIVKIIFLITQYASGAITQNESLVANSLTIPPEGTVDYYKFFDIEKDKKYIEDMLSNYYKGSKNTTVQDVKGDPQEIENDEENDEEKDEVVPKKTPIKLDKKILLIPATEANENIQIPIPSPIPKKKRTIKKRPKLIIVESGDENIVVPGKPIDSTASEKIFNPLTNRHVKNTTANRKKIEKQTLKQGGKSKKKTRKNKGNKYL